MYIRVKEQLMDLSVPRVMGIINVTPDSFYSGSRKQTEQEIIQRIEQLKEEEADIIDVGAYSSRPGANHITTEEEISRLTFCLSLLNKYYPEAILSVDTFRAEVAKYSVKNHGVAIINDISAGELDCKMFETVAELQVPYCMMHMRGTPATMAQLTQYQNFKEDILLYFAKKKHELTCLGVNDIIIDPGFGFSKNLEQNYQLLAILEEFHIFELPILVGVSRKKMIRDYLNCNTEESLNGTTVINTYALTKGAHILRVHDVKEAKQAVKLLHYLSQFN